MYRYAIRPNLQTKPQRKEILVPNPICSTRVTLIPKIWILMAGCSGCWMEFDQVKMMRGNHSTFLTYHFYSDPFQHWIAFQTSLSILDRQGLTQKLAHCFDCCSFMAKQGEKKHAIIIHYPRWASERCEYIHVCTYFTDLYSMHEIRHVDTFI